MPRRPQRNAGRTPLSQRPTRALYSEPGRYPVRRGQSTRRAIVPMLEDLAALVRPEHLASVRHQVRPGECVAVYATTHGGGRAVITGPERAHGRPPLRLDDRWHLVGVVEITEDGERALPTAWPTRVATPRPTREAA